MNRAAFIGIGVCVLVLASLVPAALTGPPALKAPQAGPIRMAASSPDVGSGNASQVVYHHGWGGLTEDDVTSLEADAQGNVYVVGGDVDTSTGSTLAYVAKFDPLGELLWNRVLHVSGADLTFEWDSCIDAAGNFVVSLDLVNYTPYHDESLIAKFSPAGDLLYAETLDAMALSYRMASDPSTGGVIVIGDVTYGEGRIVALAADGSVRWARALAPGLGASPWGLVVDAAGNSYVLTDRDTGDVGIAKFAANGHLVAQAILSTPVGEYSYDLALGHDGYLYALGFSYGIGEPLLAKLGLDLTPVWSEYLGRIEWSDAPFRVVPLPGGDIDLFGSSSNGTAWQMIVYRMGPDGSVRQATGFPPMTWADSLILWDATVAPGGGILVGGGAWGHLPGTGEVILDSELWTVDGAWVADDLVWDSLPGSQATERAVTLDDPVVPTDDFRSFEGEQAWYAGIDAPVAPPTVRVTASPQASIWSYSFTSSVENGTPPYTYRWSFGDGNFSSSAAPDHVFSLASEFVVQLSVKDGTGAVGVGQVRIHVGSVPVIASVDYSPANPAPGGTVDFFANASDPDGGGIVRYDWDFGDGTLATSTDASVQHTYWYAASYPVKVTVTDDESDTATYAFYVTVTGPFTLQVWTGTDRSWSLPANIRVDGVPMDDRALNGMRLMTGTHVVSFSDVPGYGTPPPVTFTPYAGEFVSVAANYESYGFLRVRTEPAVPATISVNGVPMDDWGLWLPVPPGTYTVSFGAVDGYDPPPSQVVTVSAFDNTEVVGAYVANAAAVGPDPGTYGRLRVTTALDDGREGAPSTISVDGVPRDQWALNYLELPPGVHTVSFSGVPGLATPSPIDVTIVAGQTSSVVGTFQVQGWLRVITSPAVYGAISVDGIPRDMWGMWQALPPGNHTVSFGPVIGGCYWSCVVPPPQTVEVTPGNLTVVVGDYTGTSLLANAGTNADSVPRTGWTPSGPAHGTREGAHPSAGVGALSRAIAADAVSPSPWARLRDAPSAVAPIPLAARSGDLRLGVPLPVVGAAGSIALLPLMAPRRDRGPRDDVERPGS